MENHLYICQYCSKEYKPNRRQKQKYCSNSCRRRAFTIRKFKGVNKPAQENKNAQEKKNENHELLELLECSELATLLSKRRE
jgi:hypothetical protein